MSVSHIHGQYKSNTNIIELYSKRSTAFKFGFREIVAVFYRAIQKSEKTLQSGERTQQQQTFYRPWHHCEDCKDLFFSKLIILQWAKD